MWEILDRLAIPNWILRLLKSLHEDTTSKIKGRNELSEGWKPQCGLREGCATSPTLFNIYHSQVVRLAKALREEAAKGANEECGLKWSWRAGSSMPPKHVRVATTRAGREKFEITESIFADDSTLIGRTSELKPGKEVVKQAMKEYEEKCQDGKEESISYGTEAANKARMLGTRIGRKDDLKARVQRGNAAWYKTKKWLWRSKLSM